MTLRPPGDRVQNTVVRLSEYVVTSTTISNVTFESCQIIGPAVVLPLNETLFSGCAWEGTPEAILWPIEDDRELLIGTIVLDHCEFYGCRISGIGVAVRRSEMDAVKGGFLEGE